MKKKWLLITAVLVVLFAIGAYLYVFHKPHRNIAGADADFTIAAPVLFAEFETDENAANAKYLDKIITVSGAVSVIETASDGNLNITLAGGDMSGVSCSMLPEAKGESSKLKEGDKVKIKGLCTGYLMDVVLTNCTIVEE